MIHARVGLLIFLCLFTDNMKWDTNVTKKIGQFGAIFSHITYQNLKYEGCMLGT